MGSYSASLQEDLPAPFKKKRVVFYQQGLKVYGLIPYVLQRKLKAQFFSNAYCSGGSMLVMSTSEANWTAIPYAQPETHVQALLHWLYSDEGFEVALASPQNWHDDIFSANVFRYRPHTWFPLGSEAREGFLQVTSRSEEAVARSTIAEILALPMRKDTDADKEKE